MKWNELATDSRGLLEVFQDCPSLDEAVLMEIIFHQDGPRVTMRINLRDYPRRPPEKWKRMEYNAAQLQLSCIGVLDVKVLGWSTYNAVSIDVTRNTQAELQLRAKGQGTDLNIIFEFLNIDRISAYKKGSDSAG